jgi:hypothetical protein
VVPAGQREVKPTEMGERPAVAELDPGGRLEFPL